MKKFLLILCALFCSQVVCLSEEIYFDNEVYKLKFSALAPQTNGYGNEYYKGLENASEWSKMIGVYYYPNESNPIKYAQDFDKIVENTENSMLLKLIENKRSDKSALSLIVNGCESAKKYFEYDIYKFEKHPTKGMLVTKYAQKYYFSHKDEITALANQIKENNDKYLEMIVMSSPPRIIEEDIAFEN